MVGGEGHSGEGNWVVYVATRIEGREAKQRGWLRCRTSKCLWM